MNPLAKVPGHLENLKTNQRYIQVKLGSLNRISSHRAQGNLAGFNIANLSKLHLSCVTGLHYTANLPERAYAHFRLWLYYGLKDIERKLLPASDGLDDDQIATLTINVYGSELVCPALIQEARFYYITDWFEYFFSAVVLDDRQTMEVLAQMRYDPIFDWADDSQKIYSDLLMGFFGLEPHDMEQTFQAFIDASSQGRVNDASFVHTSDIKLPLFEVMQQMFSDDEQAYRQSMHKALHRHYEFWRQDKLKGNIAGNLSLPLTAMARVAYKRFGYTLDFENDYVPEYFYQVDDEIVQEPIDFGPFEPLPA